MNQYFWTGLYTALTRLTSARAESVQSIFAAVETGFNALPAPSALQNDAVTYCDDTGAANAYVITLPVAASQTPITTLTEGLRVRFKPQYSNTGASYITVNGILPPVNITHFDGSALLPGDISADGISDATFDGTNFQLLNPWALMGAQSPAAAASSAAASATSAASSAASATASANSATNSANSATAAAASAAAAAASLPSFVLQAQGIW